MLFARTSDGTMLPYSEITFAHKNIAFTEAPDLGFLAELGYAPVVDGDQPVLVMGAQIAARNTIATLVGEEWQRSWTVTDIPVEKKFVNAERNRRIAAGFVWNGKTYQSDPESLANIAGAATSAIAALVAGVAPTEVYWTGTGAPFTWLADDNTLTQMTPQDIISFGNAAMTHKAAIVYAGRSLKDMSPIPADFADDKYWP